MIQLKLSGNSGHCLGSTRHPCDKTHALFVRQSSVAEGCVKMGRRMWKSDVSRSARHGHFTGSNRSMVSYEDRKLLWNSRVWKAIRRGSAEKEVRSWTGAWKQISKQRRRVYVSYDPSMVTALWHGIRMDEESFTGKKTCIKEKEKRGGIHQPFYGTWIMDFMLRQDAGKFMLGKYLSDKKIPWE